MLCRWGREDYGKSSEQTEVLLGNWNLITTGQDSALWTVEVWALEFTFECSCWVVVVCVGEEDPDREQCAEFYLSLTSITSLQFPMLEIWPTPCMCKAHDLPPIYTPALAKYILGTNLRYKTTEILTRFTPFFFSVRETSCKYPTIGEYCPKD